MFTKSCLQNGDIVETKIETRYIYLEVAGQGFLSSLFYAPDISFYNDDLTAANGNGAEDIVKVYRLNYFPSLDKAMSHNFSDKFLCWKRKS